MVLPDRIELSTSPLPRECSTTELRQQTGHRENRPSGPRPSAGGSCHKVSPGASAAAGCSGQERPSCWGKSTKITALPDQRPSFGLLPALPLQRGRPVAGRTLPIRAGDRRPDGTYVRRLFRPWLSADWPQLCRETTRRDPRARVPESQDPEVRGIGDDGAEEGRHAGQGIAAGPVEAGIAREPEASQGAGAGAQAGVGGAYQPSRSWIR